MPTITVSTSTTGQTINGALYGLSTTMGEGAGVWDYSPFLDTAMQNVANQYPIGSLRHNWELNTFMGNGGNFGIFKTRASAPNSPDFSKLDNYLNGIASMRKFLPTTSRLIITMGCPDWMNTSSSSDMTLLGQCAVKVAQYIKSKGSECFYWDLINEPDGLVSLSDLILMYNNVAPALKAYNSSYKVGGLAYTYYHDLTTFMSSCHPDFISFHQYPTNGQDGNSVLTCMQTAASFQSLMAGVKTDMNNAGCAASAEIFLGEYNWDGNFPIYDLNNQNYICGVHASVITTACALSNSNVTMGALWCLLNGEPYSQIGDDGAWGARPGIMTLSKLSLTMPGPQLSVSGSTGNMNVLATRQGTGHAVTINNYDPNSALSVNLVLSGATASTYTYWEMGSAHQTSPLISSIPASQLATLSIPKLSTVVISSQGTTGGGGTVGSLPPGTTGLDKFSIGGTTKTIAYPSAYGRIRDVIQAQDGSLFFLTSNSDEVGGQASDKIYKVTKLP